MGIELKAAPRTVLGKKVKQLRREGFIPGVVYGAALEEPISVQVDARELRKVLQEAGVSHLIDLRIEGRSRPVNVLVRDVQRDPVRHTLLHVDFLAVRMDEAVRIEVPIHLTGEPAPVAQNIALVSQVLEEIEVEALPAHLPSEIEVDVTDLLKEVGDVLTVADLPVPEGVEIITEGDIAVAVLEPLRAEEAVEAESTEAPAAAGDVEVIGEREEEEE
ncbi:MAG: 50S ribosomal protein L25 [Ardenticatenia bacterium]|nr:MAG: 50S ribosomal protein L25 [Ardenticatenia bacterium]